MEKNTKKIIIIQRVFTPSKGGDSRRIEELIKFLTEYSMVKVLTTRTDNINESNEIVETINADPLSFLGRWKFFLGSLIKILKFKPDTLVINAPFLEISPLIIICKIFKIKTIIYMTLIGQDGPFDLIKHKYPFVFKKIFLYFLGKSDLILSLGSGLAKQAEDCGWNKKKIIILPHFKDSKIFYPLERDEEKEKIKDKFNLKRNDFICSFVGYLVPRKGFHNLVDAWNKVSENILNAKLLIAGPMEIGLEEWAKNQLNKLKNDSFIYFGPVEKERVSEILKISDLLLFPSYSEGLGGILIEAMMCGVCCIASKLDGSTTDLIKNRENGVLIEPGNVNELADCIIDLYKNADLKNQLKNNAFLYGRDFGLEKMKYKYIEIFIK